MNAKYSAILDVLYAERATLTRKRRLKTLTSLEVIRLNELDAYIDEIELASIRIKKCGFSLFPQR